jgi:DNA-3-methyladenine glycosylase
MPLQLKPVTRRALPKDTIAMAQWLIGCVLVRETDDGILTGRIVETEAYLPDDAASHSYRGQTPRNRSMFTKRGHAYVYFIYGRSFMLNISSEDIGIGAAVLIRAAEPLSGIEQMQRNRGCNVLTDLARGPGRLAQAFKIDRSLDGIDMCAPGPLWLARDAVKALTVDTSTRIGITQNVDALWRFYAKDNAHVSGPKALRVKAVKK